MNKHEKIAVVADSCCDVPKNVAEKYDIRILPIHIIYPEGDYLDGVTIQAETIYDRFPDEIPNTSMPSLLEAQEFLEGLAEEGFTHVIATCISDHLSSTVNVVQVAASEVPQLKTFVFNTKNISIGSGMFAIWAAMQVRRGRSYDDIIEELDRKRADSRVGFYMDSLEYLYKGGRIGNVSYKIADMLQIKPVISCDPDGIFYTVTKKRGRRKALNSLIEWIMSFSMGRRCWLAVMHGGANEEGLKAAHTLREQMPEARFVVHNEQINPSLAVNTGPGLIGICIFIL